MPIALITGITGQDGGFLAERLLSDGWDVHGLIRHGDEHATALEQRHPAVTTHRGDLTDAQAIDALVTSVQPDEIYNLGGISSVALSWQQPLLTAEVNGLGAARLFEAAWQFQQRVGRPVRVLQASSAEMFGIPSESPQSETTPVRPRTPYGAAKAFAHNLVAVYRTRGLHACSCVLFNHESPRRPETFVTRKIAKAAAMIAAGKQESLMLGNLDARRDWGWAPDYVDAMVRAIRHDKPDDYVIATGEAHSVREFVAVAFARAGVPDWPRYVMIDESFVRPGDAPELVGDFTKARTVLGWTPTLTFEQVVARMVDEDVSELQGG
jgi:GDPmannose 4,6-dehydratase